MTEKKQITIYELLPLLRKGWVAMDKDKNWHWYEVRPIKLRNIWGAGGRVEFISGIYTIAPFDGDWKDSLMEVK